MKKSKILACIICFSFVFVRPTKKVSVSAEYSLGKAECVMELSSRRILYGKNLNEELPMASTTKICTAITVIDRCIDLDEEFEIPNDAIGVEGSSVYLKQGDKYTVNDLLYGLMLRSGNDCAVALSLKIGDNIDVFSRYMNITAKKSGAFHTNFVNPHGLPNKNHYTTAKDLSLITCYAMENPVFRQIVSTKKYEKTGWVNKNKLLYSYDGATGVKTGYTKEAGRCLVSAVERNGMVLICTLLNCYQTYERTKVLMDDAFNNYEMKKLQDKDTSVFVETQDGKFNAHTKSDIFYPLLKEEKSSIRKEIIAYNNIIFDDFGEIIGKMSFYISNHLLFSENLYKL